MKRVLLPALFTFIAMLVWQVLVHAVSAVIYTAAFHLQSQAAASAISVNWALNDLFNITMELVMLFVLAKFVKKAEQVPFTWERVTFERDFAGARANGSGVPFDCARHESRS